MKVSELCSTLVTPYIIAAQNNNKQATHS